jgi:DNA-binding NtrC family response regulator
MSMRGPDVTPETIWRRQSRCSGNPFIMAALEDTAIRRTLVLTRSNKVKAARLLGIATSTLYEKVKRSDL